MDVQNLQKLLFATALQACRASLSVFGIYIGLLLVFGLITSVVESHLQSVFLARIRGLLLIILIGLAFPLLKLLKLLETGRSITTSKADAIRDLVYANVGTQVIAADTPSVVPELSSRPFP